MSDATDDLDDMPYRIGNKPKKISEPLYRKKTELQPVCPNCLSDIEVKDPGKMYRDCNCGEWRNDILLGWEYIPKTNPTHQPKQHEEARMTKSDVKTYIGEDNTKPEFFARWSLRDLQVECARLNKVLKEIRELAPPKTLTKETKTCVTKDTPL